MSVPLLKQQECSSIQFGEIKSDRKLLHVKPSQVYVIQPSIIVAVKTSSKKTPRINIYTSALGFSNCLLAVPKPSLPPSWFSPSQGFFASPSTPSVP